MSFLGNLFNPSAATAQARREKVRNFLAPTETESAARRKDVFGSESKQIGRAHV